MTRELGEERGMKSNQKAARSMHLRTIVVCALACVVTLVFASGTLRGFAVNSTSTNASAERVVIAVEGMYCDSCAAGVKAMLKRTPGVISSDVSYQKKEAIVYYDSQKTTPEKIVEAINNLGYKASVKNKG